MNQTINFKIEDVSGKTWDFNTLASFTDFIEKEINFWGESNQDISNTTKYFTQNGHLAALQKKINGWGDEVNDWTAQQIKQNISANIGNIKNNWLWSGHPYVPIFIEYCKLNKNTAEGFLEVLLNNTANYTNNYDYLKGYLLAYEFQMQGKSEITQRQIAEEQSYEYLRDKLDNKTNELIEKVDTFEGEFNEFQENTLAYTEKAKRVNGKLLNRTQRKREEEFSTYMKDSKDKIKELENTYQEKLRLEKPATYWRRKASDYKFQGLIWSVILLVIILTGIEQFGNFFSSWLEGKPTDIELKSLQGAVLFMTIITLYAILIKGISKMVFSSFHLQRDAEEREQLTHVYLSLTHEDGKIDEDSRKIVLQALFSRADSGLLHKDSTPTMPGIGELVKASGAK